MLALALTLLDDETCKSCGTPAWLGHSTNNEIAFTVKSSTCYGCAELERSRNGVSGDGSAKRKPRPGEVQYVVPHNIWPDEPLPSRREGYMSEED